MGLLTIVKRILFKKEFNYFERRIKLFHKDIFSYTLENRRLNSELKELEKKNKTLLNKIKKLREKI